MQLTRALLATLSRGVTTANSSYRLRSRTFNLQLSYAFVGELRIYAS